MSPSWYIAIPVLCLAAGCFIGCVAILRTADRHRVPVVGLVLQRTRYRRPPALEVSYRVPLHDGHFRARLTAGFAMAQEGEPITVYVNPDNPRDVSLGPGGYSRVWAVLLGVWGLMSVAFAVRVLTL